MTDDLPPFTLRPECVKCGSDRVRLSFGFEAVPENREFLAVWCERCAFSWRMKTKDASK